MKVRRFNYLGRLACGVVALWVSSSSLSDLTHRHF